MDKRQEDKLDKVVEDIGEIKTILAVNTEIVKQHEQRSTQLEKRVAPIERHVVIVNAIIKIIGTLIAGGLIGTLVELFILRK